MCIRDSTEGDYNSAIGKGSLNDNTEGSNNTALGYLSGNTGTNDITTGNQNTLLGASTAVSSATATNQIVIGYGAIGKGDNTVTIGNGDITAWSASDDNEVDLGSSSVEFKDLYIDGTANLDAVDIDGGAIDGAAIGANSASTGAFTTITASNSVTANANLTGGNGAQVMTNNGFNNVTFKYDAITIEQLNGELSGDTINGGFGSAPKFPQFPSLSFCIDNTSTKLEDKKIKHTLDRMCTSGINDYVDGGFYRYSVDDLWMIPHFEKMLYDNGPMMSILCDSYVKFGDALYIDKAKEIYNWARIFMTSEEGVFYSTIDADSEGSEGKYYVFSDDELKKTLEKEEIDLLNEYLLDLNKPNFEGNHHLHLHRKKENDFKKNKQKFMPIFKKLSANRKQKVLPSVDKKILLSWNCLYIKGLIKLYKITKEEDILKAINKALDFITNRMVSSETIYSCFNEEPCFPGYLDDYALLGSVLIDYLSIEWNQNYYDTCMRVCDDLMNNFEDKEKGGFFFTSNQHEQLFYRPKSISDDSVPSGLIYATDTLLYMGFISGNQKYIEAAHRALDFIYKSIDDNLTSSVSAINLLREDNLEKEIIIVRTNKKT